MADSSPERQDPLWAVVPVYDIATDSLRMRCLGRTLSRLQSQNVPTLIVEAAPAGKPAVPRRLCTHRLTLALSDRHAGLWQKEALCNLAETNLPATCTKIVFCDADASWPRDDWPDLVSQLLDRYPFVQPFERVEYERPDGSIGRTWSARLRARRSDRGVVGLAHAFRRDTFRAIGGYYDRAITGGADEFALAAAHPSRKPIDRLQHHPAILDDATAWLNRARRIIGGQATYAPLTIRHLWHGHRPAGYYRRTHRRLEEVAPELDVRRDLLKQRNGLLAWRDPASPPARHLRSVTAARRSLAASSATSTPRKPIAVCAVLAQLRGGGAAMSICEWITAMQARAAATGVHWAGVAIKSLRRADPWVLARIAEQCPVWAPRSQVASTAPRGVVPCPSWADAVSRAIEAADVIHPWGFKHRPPGRWESNLVCVANGSGRWMSTRLEPWADHIAAGWALSAPALKAVPSPMRHKFQIIRWPLDRSRLLPSRPPHHIRRELGIAPGDRVLLWMGRLSPLKRPHRALQCLQHLPDHWRLLCLGISQKSTWKPGPRHARLIASPRVKMTSCPPHRIGNLLAIADACIHTSNGEGGPRVAAEAWAAGVPLVSTPVGLVAEHRDTPLARIVAPRADGKTWANAVREAARDRHQAIHAKQWAHTQCDPDRQVQRLCEVFRRAAAP